MTSSAQTFDVTGLTLGEVVRKAAQCYADLPFFDDGKTLVSFDSFDRMVDRVVVGLHGLGVRTGNHVAVWLGNSFEWALMYFACGRMGAVMVPINSRYTAKEVQYVLSQSDSILLVMALHEFGKDFSQTLTQVAPEINSQTVGQLNVPQLPALKTVVTVGLTTPRYAIEFSELLNTTNNDALLKTLSAQVTPEHASIICYTSGTTGNPKGVIHNHHVMAQARRVGTALDLRVGDAILGHMPLYHVAGLYMGLVPALLLGARFVNMHYWDADQALALMSSKRINIFGGIPTHFVDLCHNPNLTSADLSSIRNAWIGGSPVMQSTFEAFKTKLGISTLMSTYGMTENTISTTFNRLSDPIDVCCQNRAPILGPTEVKIVHPQTSQPCKLGETGEIWCRGQTVMLGYYKNPLATKAVMTTDGWLKTGDLGDMDSNQYLRVTGRLKDMYKTGGINVYPSEIEQVLVKHPAVRQVSIVGVPDDRLGEVGYAFVQCHEHHTLSVEDITFFCKDQLAKYKLPKHLEIVTSIPRTNTGKVQKSVLAELALARITSQRALETAPSFLKGERPVH
jgi:fatty-acyl-CoA synthase